MEAEYNDIVAWDFKGVVDVFGGRDKSRKFTVKTKDELNGLLTNEDFIAADTLQFVELYMPKEDAPRGLVMTAEASAQNNAKTE